MSSWQLGFDLISAFLLSAGLLFHYGNWYRHHVIVTLSVLVSWYFSFIIIFVLPIDVSTTAYRQCKASQNTTTSNFTDSNVTITSICQKPSSYVGDVVLTDLWTLIYWSSQFLTWLILPMMQSYTQAGEFTVKGKVRSALLDNAIYYGIYLFICSILLIYLATRPESELHWVQLKAVASSASNSWGLFLLVFMLGYGLVSVPQTLWYSSCKGYSLNNAYFKVAKLSQERNSTEESLDDVLESVQTCIKTLQSTTTTSDQNLYRFIETIEFQIPLEFRERMKRRRVEGNIPQVDEKILVKLNRQVKKTLQNYHRSERQWEDMISKTVRLEDVERNSKSGDGRFKNSLGDDQGFLSKYICTPVIEWYWRCKIERWLLKILSVWAAIMSLFVIWSESTFFNRSPVLSVFAIFLNLAKESYDYVTIELITTITIAYMAVCAFYTVFKIRIFNFYYLARNHQTDEYSLIFSGMLLCRLTPPLCLNVITLFQLDSHIIKQREEETSYTKVMGHMDILSLIADGFNIYFPMGILIVAILTYFKVGLRVLSIIGFHQFINDLDEITSDLVEEGIQLVQREKRRRLRIVETSSLSRYSRSPMSNLDEANRSGSVSGLSRQRSLERNSRLVVESTSGRNYGGFEPPRDIFNDV